MRMDIIIHHSIIFYLQLFPGVNPGNDELRKAGVVVLEPPCIAMIDRWISVSRQFPTVHVRHVWPTLALAHAHVHVRVRVRVRLLRTCDIVCYHMTTAKFESQLMLRSFCSSALVK